MVLSEPSTMPSELLPIGAVLEELRPQFPTLTHSSLRFLEREGLIQATRTPGGHRLYSRGDIERITRIKTWQQGRLSLREIRERLDRYDRFNDPDQLADQFLDHILHGELTEAHKTVTLASESGMTLEQLFGQVLEPALQEIGRLWERGELLIAQEKEYSEFSREIIVDLTLRHAQKHVNGPVMVAACVEGERHELGLRMICGLLRSDGFQVHFLGADVSSEFLIQACTLHRPAAVLLSVSLRQNLGALEEAMHGLRSLEIDPVIVGGYLATLVPEKLVALGAHPVVGGSITDAFKTILDVVPSPGW